MLGGEKKKVHGETVRFDPRGLLGPPELSRAIHTPSPDMSLPFRKRQNNEAKKKKKRKKYKRKLETETKLQTTSALTCSN